jgi:hypothetical protein
VRTIFGRRRLLPGQTHIDFVDQLSALQSVIGALGPEATMRRLAQLLIDEGNESLKRFQIPAPPTNQQLRG